MKNKKTAQDKKMQRLLNKILKYETEDNTIIHYLKFDNERIKEKYEVALDKIGRLQYCCEIYAKKNKELLRSKNG